MQAAKTSMQLNPVCILTNRRLIAETHKSQKLNEFIINGTYLHQVLVEAKLNLESHEHEQSETTFNEVHKRKSSRQNATILPVAVGFLFGNNWCPVRGRLGSSSGNRSATYRGDLWLHRYCIPSPEFWGPRELPVSARSLIRPGGCT